MPETFFQERKRRIISDLASFADPGGVTVTGGERYFDATWTMRGELRDASFRISADRGITVTIDRRRQRYEAFLAGPTMADLRNIAQMTKLAMHTDIFVPTKAKRTDREDSTTEPATDLLVKILEVDRPEVTPVIVVTGEAGAGKTRVLQELVRRQAERYLDGQTEMLLLYVNAQGRALARLNEALATELQDLKVNLTYHSIATLTRVGILAPVIDGFDELLGVTGYDDAFNSLASFLEQLDGDGVLVASARSVYYEEEFLNRASQTSTEGPQSWSNVSVKIIPWSVQDRNQFLQELVASQSISKSDRNDLRVQLKEVFRNHDELAKKPLFVAKVVDLLRAGRKFQVDDDLLGSLTQRFLEREQQEKLLDRNQNPLITKAQLSSLMSELAEEMWNQETRELDQASVREIAEYVLDDKDIPESSCQIVIQRMSTLAFLALGQKHGSVCFEHEVFFFNFLSRRIVRRFIQGADIRVILSRSSLPEFVADRVSYELAQQGEISSLSDLRKILRRLAKSGQVEWRRTTQVRENSGTIILALLRRFSGSGSKKCEVFNCLISTVVFPGGSLSDVTLRNCTFSDVLVRRTNFTRTKIIDCQARDVVLVEPRISIDSTRFELSGLRIPEDVLGIRELNRQGGFTTYNPTEISRILEECGANVDSSDSLAVRRDVPDAILKLLERLIRAYRRANPICEVDPHLAGLFNHPSWPILVDRLIEHGLVQKENRRSSGTPKTFLRRRFLTDQLMLGQRRSNQVDPRIARFWDSLEDLTA